MNQNKRRPSFHEPYRTVKCACGSWVTEKWNYHTCHCETEHVCRFTPSYSEQK